MLIKKAGPDAIKKMTMYMAIEHFLEVDHLYWENVKGYAVVNITDIAPRYGYYEGLKTDLIAIPFLSIKFFCRQPSSERDVYCNGMLLNTPVSIMREKAELYNKIKPLVKKEHMDKVDIIWLANGNIGTTLYRFDVRNDFFSFFFDVECPTYFSFRSFKVIDLN